MRQRAGQEPPLGSEWQSEQAAVTVDWHLSIAHVVIDGEVDECSREIESRWMTRLNNVHFQWNVGSLRRDR